MGRYLSFLELCIVVVLVGHILHFIMQEIMQITISLFFTQHTYKIRDKQMIVILHRNRPGQQTIIEYMNTAFKKRCVVFCSFAFYTLKIHA